MTDQTDQTTNRAKKGGEGETAVDLDPATIEDIESVPGLQTALEMIGHAYIETERTGECTLHFEKSPKGELLIYDVTQHLKVLEAQHDA